MSKIENKKIEDQVFEEQKFEFLLYVNDHIVCQRGFNIRDYNEESIHSLELKELMDSLIGMNNGSFGELGIIPNYLKQKSINLLWENYNPYSGVDGYKQPNKKGDVFKFEIKVEKESKVIGEFPNEFFTLNSKINVDIREIIPNIISEIRYFLSFKNYEKVLV